MLVCVLRAACVRVPVLACVCMYVVCVCVSVFSPAPVYTFFVKLVFLLPCKLEQKFSYREHH